MMKSLSRLALAFALGAPAAAAASPGQHGEGHKAGMIARFDRNGDGKLDDGERAAMKAQHEAMRAQRQQEMLARYDLDKDGKLSDTERAAMRHDHLVARFSAMDTNRDGNVSFVEFEAAAKKMGSGRRHFNHHRGRGWRGGN